MTVRDNAGGSIDVAALSEKVRNVRLRLECATKCLLGDLGDERSPAIAVFWEVVDALDGIQAELAGSTKGQMKTHGGGDA